MNLLELTGVSKTFHTEKRAVQALQGVQLALARDDFACILGRSGSGKSTLLNLCAGLLTPDAGSIRFDGRELTGLDDDALSRLRNRSIGYIMQGYALLPNLTVRANVRLPYDMYPDGAHTDPDVEADRLLAIVGLADKAEGYPAELSGGEIRRVEIARSLINSPGLLLADEPTGDLDKLTAASILTLFADIHRRGTAILMVTHDLEATGVANRIFTMESGVLCEGDLITPRIGR